MGPTGRGASQRDFASRLREALHDRALTSRQLAARLGVSDNTVSSWLTGTFHPRTPRLIEIADALDIDMTDLVRDGKADAGSDREAPSTRAAAADAIIDRLAGLELEQAVEGLRDSAPDLLNVLRDAQEHAHRGGR